MIDPGLLRRNLAGTVSVGDTGRKLRRSVTCDAVYRRDGHARRAVSLCDRAPGPESSIHATRRTDLAHTLKIRIIMEPIPSRSRLDNPYVVRLFPGAWLWTQLTVA